MPGTIIPTTSLLAVTVAVEVVVAVAEGVVPVAEAVSVASALEAVDDEVAVEKGSVC